MKIALLRHRVSGWGGAEATLSYLARGLVAAGHEVAVLSTDTQAAAEAVLGPGVHVVPVPVWGGKTGRVLSFAYNCRRLIPQLNVQVVFSLERTLRQDVYRAGDGCHREWLARRAALSSPAAALLRKLTPFHQAMLWLERRLFGDPGLRRVVANSHQVKEEVMRHYYLAPECCLTVIHNGLDHARFRPLFGKERREVLERLGEPLGAQVVLFAGSGFARKGLAYLLQAFAGLREKDARLWVVGKGRIGPYQAMAARLRVADRVKFWGPQTQVAPFYQAATVLALPTIYDPCSNVALEALGCGCPVVTTAANGAKEFISAGENGAILGRPDDIPALAQALGRFLDLGQDRRVREAAAQAVAHLDWDVTVSRTLAVLEEAAGSAPARI